MGYLLKSQGFENIHIFEASNRVGGKCHTAIFNDYHYDFGACALHVNYEPLTDLLTELDLIADLRTAPQKKMYAAINEEKSGIRFITLKEWLLSEFKKIYKEEKSVSNFLLMLGLPFKLAKAVHKWHKLYHECMDEYGYPKLTKDKDAAFYSQLTGDYLEKNDMSILKYAFSLSYTGMGYGFVSEIPLLYTLIWQTPLYTKNFRTKLGFPRVPLMRNLFHGYQSFVERLIQKGNLNVRLNFPVTAIEKNANGKIRISRVDTHLEDFDIVFIAAPPHPMKNVITYLDEERKHIINSLYTSDPFSVYMVKIEDSPVYPPLIFFPEALNPPPMMPNVSNNIVFAMMNTKSLYFKSNSGEPQYFLCYQLKDYFRRDGHDDVKAMCEDLKIKLNSMNVHNYTVKYQECWSYFPRFNQEAIRKEYPWKYIKTQGIDNTYFIGSSACFESVIDVIRYNHRILDLVMKRCE